MKAKDTEQNTKDLKNNSNIKHNGEKHPLF